MCASLLGALVGGCQSEMAAGWAEIPGGDRSSRAFDIPRLDGIEIDGSAADWRGRGFRVETLAGPEGEVTEPSDLDGALHLAWNDGGLLVLLEVTDDVAAEYDRLDRLYRKDSAEVFVSDGPGSANRYQVYVSSGTDPAYGRPRTHVNDYRPGSTDGKRKPPAVQVAARPRNGGYVIELLLPWTNLDVEPAAGRQIGFQLYLNDADGPEGYPTHWTRLVWHPGARSSEAPEQMHALRLARSAGPASIAAVRSNVRIERGRAEVTVVAPAALVGEVVEVRRGAKVLGRSALRARRGRAVADVRADLPAPGEPSGGVEVVVADRQRTPLGLGDTARQRALALVMQEIRFEPYCFAGPSFPPCDFTRPLEAEKLLGPYRVKVAYYDRSFREVSEPAGPGRYGAVIDILPDRGRRIRRYRTIYRQPEQIHGVWWMGVDLGGRIIPPPQQGVEPRVADEQNDQIMDYAGKLWWRARVMDPQQAVLLAGLSEMRPGEHTDFASDAVTRDAQWWVAMKRKLHGLEQRFPGGVVCPRPVRGAAAPVLREGSAAEAGMKQDAAEAIDALCRQWVEASGEPFAVCIARRGVIVLHKGYGRRDGEPMTVHTPSWLASITKLLAATCLMMLVDQGLVDLDEPIETYLPAFRRVETRPKITVRDVYRHTSGLPHAWPRMTHDTEQVMAEVAPLAEVRRRWEYNTAVCELGGKIIESVSGEALAAFYRNHLFGPLGCKHTTARGAGGDAWSTPLELARIGQMLLNKGAYGKMRFFSQATMAKMLPTSLADLPEPSRPWPREAWGIGVAVMGDEYAGAAAPYAAFGRQAFGHGAASSTTFVIDPKRDLVVVVTRNRAGRDFARYATKLTETILAQIESGQGDAGD
jgi:CubicO group peptidase (beta-lactamase class C family)